jgi:cardiolipin synthase
MMEQTGGSMINRRLFAFVPNLISIGRLVLVPVSVEFIASHRYKEAFAAFIIAGVSDGIDGWIARRFDLRSELGAYLDALADKALLIAIYVTLAIMGVLPAAIALLVVFRDVMIMGGVILSWLVDKPVAIRPLYISKANTLAQIGFAALVLAMLAFDWQAGLWFTISLWTVAALTLASLAAYFRRWVEHMSV